MRKRYILAFGVLTAVFLLALPVMLNTTAPFCSINSANAQDDNPCAIQEATNSALVAENANLQATIDSQPLVIVVTATPILSPTPNETSLADESVSMTATALPEGCVIHVVQSGDTPFAIAEAYGADPFDMLTVNELDDETATQLQIGDILIVPLENCAIEEFVTVETETPTFTPTDLDFTATAVAEQATEVEAESEAVEGTPTFTPTATIQLPPTSTGSQLSLSVEGAGDIDLEGVVIFNESNTQSITGWVLSDTEGNEFEFPDVILYSNTTLTLFTGSGEDTPVVLFWRLDAPIWESGDVITITDADDTVQATYLVP